MQKIKNIILDYGNVIFMIDFARARESFTRLGIKSVDSFFGHRGQDGLFDAFDKGNITASEFRDGIRERTNRMDLSDEEIDAAWNSLLIGVPEGKHEILDYLRNKYRTFLLSNNNEIHYAYCMRHIQEKYGIRDNESLFEKTYYSHLVGMRKPDREIFDYVLSDAHILPHETLFIDDSPQHLETAISLGFHTSLCSNDVPLEEIVKILAL